MSNKHEDEMITMDVEFTQGKKKLNFQVTLPRSTLLFSAADEIAAHYLSAEILYHPTAKITLNRPGGLEPLVFELVNRWQLVGR